MAERRVSSRLMRPKTPRFWPEMKTRRGFGASWPRYPLYVRIAKRAAMMAGRYAHAKQFNRHRRQLRILRTRLGRLIRDIRRKIAGNAELEALFAWPLSRADLNSDTSFAAVSDAEQSRLSRLMSRA